MGHHVAFVLLGLGSGSVYAALAVSVVVTYRASGVINLATGAMAVYSGYTFAYLRQGELFVPIPGLPPRIHLAEALPFWFALVLAIVVTSLLSTIVYLAAFRRLRGISPVGRVVASVGLMIVIQSLIALRLGTDPAAVDRIFPNHLYKVGGIGIPADRFYFFGVVLVLVAGLAAMFRWTSFGLATRAVAENEKGAVVTGLEPNRIAIANWALSGAVAGLAGILISPVVPLSPGGYTLFIVPALAAAVFGRLNSLFLALAAGTAIGMFESEMAIFGPQHQWLPQVGLPQAIPLVAIIVVLVAGGGRLPGRGAIIERNLGVAPRPSIRVGPPALAVTAALVALVASHGSIRAGLISSLVMATIALSWVVLTGYLGQISLAQLTLSGVSAFLLVGPIQRAHVPFPLSIIMAALAAMVIGTLIGLPALRVRGLSLVIVTMAAATALEYLWFRNDELTGVIDRKTDVKSPHFFGIDLGIGSGKNYPTITFGVLSLLVLVLVAVGVVSLRRSSLGARMLAVRSNERSAAATGVDVARTKVQALAISAFIAGVGGAMLAFEQNVVSPESFSVFASLAFFTTVYLAGITTVTGAIVAGLIAEGGLVPVLLNRVIDIGGWLTPILGLGLIITMIRHPEGITGAIFAHRSSRRAARSTVDEDVAATGTSGLTLATRAAGSLHLDGLTVRYGGVVAVDNVTFEVAPGSITGLIGPNGAGKTTLIDAVTGLAPSSGRTICGDRLLTGMRPHERVRAGVGRTFQSGELWDELTVLENVAVGAAGRRVLPWQRTQVGGPDPEAVLEFLGLKALRDTRVSELSQGRRRLVAIARSLVTGPAVLLLDEPAAGLDSNESMWLAERLRAIRDAGVTMLVVDHDMSLMLSVCDHIHVLNFGQLVASGPPEVIKSDPAVIDAYLGRTAQEVSA